MTQKGGVIIGIVVSRRGVREGNHIDEVEKISRYIPHPESHVLLRGSHKSLGTQNTLARLRNGT